MNEQEAVYEATVQAIHDGYPACVLTVIEVQGSTPRGVGAKMLVRADGSTIGTIGGGAFEAAAIADAQAALKSGESGVRAYSIRGQGEADLGLCGGQARVFVEVLRIKPTLLVAGAGHVAQPLVQFAHLLGFRTIVVDDRADVATAERFPHVDQLVVTPFEQLLQKVQVTSQSHVVIVTRGHEHDELVLRQVLSTPAAYIGMIGSRIKVRSVFEKLLAEGVPAERLLQVHAPIGLRIGGQTPAEIALSILAEIVLVRHAGSGEPLSWRDNPLRATGSGAH